jgi:acetylglutamate synthase
LEPVVAGNRGYCAKDFHESGNAARPEAQKIGGARRPVRLVGPKREQHRSFQHKSISEIRLREPIKQSFQRILRQHQVEGLVANAGELP